MDGAVELSEHWNASRHIPAGEPDQFAELNFTGTVVWGLADDGRDPGDRLRELWNRFARFMRRAGEPFVWNYVQETGEVKGPHLHFTAYVPPSLQPKLKLRFPRWVAAHAIGPVSPDAVYFKPAWNPLGWKQYLLKEGTDEVRAAFNVPDDWPRAGGIVMGKRMAVSPPIKASARIATVTTMTPRRASSTTSTATTALAA